MFIVYYYAADEIKLKAAQEVSENLEVIFRSSKHVILNW